MTTEITYGKDYARKYIEHTLSSPYTGYKNECIAQVAHNLKADSLVDLGCNVNLLIRHPNSLRNQAEDYGIKYYGLDLSPQFFNSNLAEELGVPTNKIYNDVETLGIVGDITHLPFKPDSISLAVSADVIEHIPNPVEALTEIHRALKPNGRLIIIIPSMYKLDAVKLDHIEKRRFSTHENKLDLEEWEELIGISGFEINSHYSRPIGIASGLTYLAWINDQYVPEKAFYTDREKYSPEAHLHRAAKLAVSKIDALFDSFYQNDPSLLSTITQSLLSGDVKKALGYLGTELINNGQYEFSREDLYTLDTFFSEMQNICIDDDRVSQLTNCLNNIKNPISMLGNSSLLVLNKQLY